MMDIKISLGVMNFNKTGTTPVKCIVLEYWDKERPKRRTRYNKYKHTTFSEENFVPNYTYRYPLHHLLSLHRYKYIILRGYLFYLKSLTKKW